MGRKIVAIVSSYRKSGTIDTAVQAVLEGARTKGAETHIIYLADQHLEFCTHCRKCTQTPAWKRVPCTQNDGLESILQQLEAADAIVLGSPVNHYNATSIFRQFLERQLGFLYWPWGQALPTPQDKHLTRKAVLVSSAIMPGFCIPLLTEAPKALRVAATSLGARTVGSLWIGLAGKAPHHSLSPRILARARQMGARLA